MSKIIMMVGLPGSGKSTLAREIAEKEGAFILSADSLREELYGDINNQEHNTEVFEELYRRARNHIRLGQTIILDSTNINSKRRRGVLDQFPASVRKVCYYVGTGLTESIIRNANRDRQVPEEVINRMYKTMQIPMYYEGWDKIHLVCESNYNIYANKDRMEKMILSKDTHDNIYGGLKWFNSVVNNIDLAQDTTYHTLSVSRHMYYAYDYLFDNYQEEDRLQMLWAGLLHDIGKFNCKNFKPGSRYANFIGHDNVSAQEATEVLLRLGYSEEFTLEVVTLIQLHMRLPWNVEDNRKLMMKWCATWGTELFHKLTVFRKADESAK